jgi:two-component system, OmpR family, response regulator VicR
MKIKERALCLNKKRTTLKVGSFKKSKNTMTSEIKVLVIDDSKENTDEIVFRLAKDGFETTFVYDHSNIIEAIIEQKPDVILLNLILPFTNGLDICRKIKKNLATTNVPVIMMCDQGMDNELIISLDAGAQDFISKPLN